MAASLLALLLCLPGCGKEKNVVVKNTKPKVESNLNSEESSVKSITDTENLIQSLASEMRGLSRFFASDMSALPSFVADELECTLPSSKLNLQSAFADAKSVDSNIPMQTIDWTIADEVAKGKLSDLFSPIANGKLLEDVQLGTVKGTFLSDSEFEMKTKLEARLKGDDGVLYGIKGEQVLKWKDDGQWTLKGWKQKKLTVKKLSDSLFSDVTMSAIPDESTRKQLQRSSHQELIIKNVKDANANGEFKPARKEFSAFSDWYSAFQYPSVSVLDIDKDGFDDLCITDRWQPAQLLRNRGDGTFEDWTEQSGLKIDELANCVYFADFDNDGDSDAFVGISMGPSRFYKNENGMFVIDEENTEVIKDSSFVVSASVVDINRDGLLDLYLHTYAFGDGSIAEWSTQTAPDRDQLKTLVRLKKQHQYVDRGGPPNIVLMNRSGKFEWPNLDDTAKQFRQSYQSSWIDLDEDGDLDAYLCNDFANDVVLRNDTPRGSFKPKFVDATNEFISNSKMNFAMGASLGDFDNDADLDLYVSNMYSKAGKRICSQIDSVDSRVSVSALGNFLFENSGGQFKQVAGPDSADQHVDIVGWSFGGQFADFNNDGNLDIYVPSGFYSPPEETHTDKDL